MAEEQRKEQNSAEHHQQLPRRGPQQELRLQLGRGPRTAELPGGHSPALCGDLHRRLRLLRAGESGGEEPGPQARQQDGRLH